MHITTANKRFFKDGQLAYEAPFDTLWWQVTLDPKWVAAWTIAHYEDLLIAVVFTPGLNDLFSHNNLYALWLRDFDKYHWGADG